MKVRPREVPVWLANRIAEHRHGRGSKVGEHADDEDHWDWKLYPRTTGTLNAVCRSCGRTIEVAIGQVPEEERP